MQGRTVSTMALAFSPLPDRASAASTAAFRASMALMMPEMSPDRVVRRPFISSL